MHLDRVRYLEHLRDRMVDAVHRLEAEAPTPAQAGASDRRALLMSLRRTLAEVERTLLLLRNEASGLGLAAELNRHIPSLTRAADGEKDTSED